MILSRRDPAPRIRSRAGWALRRPGTRGATVAPATSATVRRARIPPIALPSATVGVRAGPARPLPTKSPPRTCRRSSPATCSVPRSAGRMEPLSGWEIL